MSVQTRTPSFFTTLAGTPTAVEFGGTSSSTTAFAAIRALSPTVNGPNIFAPLPTRTLLPKVG